MTSFINVNHPTHHQGADRIESAIDAALQVRQGFSATRGLATLLLSAVVAAAMVVADQVMDSVAEGHLLMMWVALWAVAFTVLALFAGAARQIAAGIKNSLDAWSRNLAQARADQRLWAAARNDYRVMADLDAAMLREEARIEVAKESASAPLTPAIRAERAIRHGRRELRDPYSYCF